MSIIPLCRKHFVTTIFIICAVIGAIGAIYTIMTYYVTAPSVPYQKKTTSEINNPIINADNENPIIRVRHQSEHIQTPPINNKNANRLIFTEKEQPPLKPSINATNSNVLVGPVNGNVSQTVNVNLSSPARHITQEQREKLLHSLMQLSNKRIIITSIYGDRETATYAAEIETVLSDAGLFSERNIIGTMIPPAYGIIISPDDSLTAVRDAFKLAQINFQIEQRPNIGIFIGLNPPADY